MSRDRYDRDDYDERGGGRGRDRYEEGRYELPPPRGDYYRRPREYGPGEDETVVRRGGRYEDDYYGRDRYDERAYRGGARPDERREDYGRDERGGEGRSLVEEGREFLRERFGGRGSGRPARPRGASRSHVRCRDIMTRDVTVATRDTTLEEVARMMRDEDTGVIPVIDREDAPAIATGEARIEDTPRVKGRVHSNGKLVGLITDRDIAVRAVAEGKDTRQVHAEEIMTTDIHTAHPNDRVLDAIRKMGDKQVRRIPVVDQDNRLRGIISMADVALETEDDRELAEALEEISSGTSFWSKVFG